jgi:RNA polymerase sigma-70 factor (ECF subfamily)
VADSTSHAWRAGARAGADAAPVLDETTFVDLYRRVARPLWGYLRRVTGDPALADDLLQEAFTRLLAEPRPPVDEAARRAWLYRTATRLAIDARRRGAREAPADEGLEARLPAPPVAARDPILAREMAGTFGQLAPQERALLWLAHVQEFSHRDIAGALGVKEASVRVLLHRARRKLAALWTRRRERL